MQQRGPNAAKNELKKKKKKILHSFPFISANFIVFEVITNGLFFPVTIFSFSFFFLRFLMINSFSKYMSTFCVLDIVIDAEGIKVDRTQNPAQMEFKI